MMLLAEVARREGIFAWVAGFAVRAAAGRTVLLFALIYGVGIVTTALLSNDATVVVLTPAVLLAVRRAQIDPLPHVFACALVANAASFVLPIANPANLVLYADRLPPLFPWFRTFALPSLAAIVVTYAILALRFRGALRGRFTEPADAPSLTRTGNRALGAILAGVLGILVASPVGAPLGASTLCAGIFVVAVDAFADRRVVLAAIRGVSWRVIALVAFLFVVVAILERTSAFAYAVDAFRTAAGAGPFRGGLAAAFALALADAIANNLPVGLAVAQALVPVHPQAWLHAAVVVGVDLGPNVAVSGSLATILWIDALRREGVEVTPLAYARVGLLVTLPALALATLSLLV